MSDNLIGFGNYGLADVADPHGGTVSTRILGPAPTMTAPRMTPAMYTATPSATVPGGTQLPSLTTDNGSGNGALVPPEQYVAPDIEEVPVTILPGELPDLAPLFDDGDGFIEQPSPNGKMDTKTMVGLGLLAAAALAAGYWFFVAKKPKGEEA